MRTICIGVLCWAILALLSVSAEAHDGRPIAVSLTQADDHSVSVDLRFPNVIDPKYRPEIRLPTHCTAGETTAIVQNGGSYRYQSTYTCRGPIAGETVSLFFPAFNPSLSTQLQYLSPDSPPVLTLLPPGRLRWTLPAKPNRFGVWRSYIWLGITHIAKGWDHLLFVGLLLVLARTPRRTLQAITGFTLGHSVTLAFGALGIVRLSIGAVEALIALSLAVLAAELLRGRKDTLLFKYPVLTAALFGLLHGFGFASVLTELGLPQSYTVSALAAFNIGVELGQIIFVVILFVAVWLASRISIIHLHQDRWVSAAVGSVGLIASVWTIGRAASLVMS